MKRSDVTNGTPAMPDVKDAMLPIHTPISPQLPQAPMMPVSPIAVNESLGQIATMAKGRAMDFKLMIQLPDGSQYYLEGSMDK